MALALSGLSGLSGINTFSGGLAGNYIASVETADGQALEAGVRLAYNNFVEGCNNDGILGAIKACCILAGARTLAGALVPLVGPAPTNNSFTGSHYSRKTGLMGGAGRYLNTNRPANADPRNSMHMAVFPTAFSADDQRFIGAWSGTGTADDFIDHRGDLRCRSVDTANNLLISSNGVVGMSRSSGTAFVARSSGVNTQGLTGNSFDPGAADVFVFAQNDNGAPFAISSARLAFYSVGESLDLALLDARVTTLMADISAAIP